MRTSAGGASAGAVRMGRSSLLAGVSSLAGGTAAAVFVEAGAGTFFARASPTLTVKDFGPRTTPYFGMVAETAARTPRTPAPGFATPTPFRGPVARGFCPAERNTA